MQYYFETNAAGVVGTGISYDGTLPTGAITCTQAQYENPSAWTLSNGAIVAAPNTLAQQRCALAALRYAKEIAGVYYTPQTGTASYLFSTGADGQSKLLSAFVSAQNGLWTNGDVWKTADGNFAALTAADVILLAKKAQSYVQACYANESALSAALESDLTTDLTQGWPNQGTSTSYTLTGNASAVKGNAITLSVTPNNCGPLNNVTLTFADDPSGGTFSATTLTLPALDTAPQTLTYTPSSVGTITLSVTNNGTLTNPDALTVSVSAG